MADEPVPEQPGASDITLADAAPRDGETNADWVRRFNAMQICVPDLELERELAAEGYYPPAGAVTARREGPARPPR